MGDSTTHCGQRGQPDLLQSRASPPTWRHAADDVSITNYEAVSDYVGHWLHRAQVLLLTGEIGQIIKLSHIPAAPAWYRSIPVAPPARFAQLGAQQDLVEATFV